jgi:hypothetical protein
VDYRLECNDKVFNFEGWTYEKIPQLVWDGLFDYARIVWRKTLQTIEKALDANTTQLGFGN